MLDKIIKQAVDGCLSVIEGKKTRQMGNEQVQEYIEKYKMIYMSSESKLKIGIITGKLHNPLGAINDQNHQVRRRENRKKGIQIPQLNKIRTSNEREEQYYRSWVIDFIKNNTKAVQLDSVVQ
ncbi:10095_t:CDS:2 [Gigaspora margarita]|uniref:10095_t:CDS:1 n=1 Tax=Gigaspora margarita TaxID=4874 RepID=A0ABN7UXI9_GIGMA|nr:10095_t:CDS:2 [Gigaspora margarita]